MIERIPHSELLEVLNYEVGKLQAVCERIAAVNAALRQSEISDEFGGNIVEDDA